MITGITEREKQLGTEIDRLVAESAEAAENFVSEMLCSVEDFNILTAAESAVYARLVCRCLLNKKFKNRLTDCIRENETIRRAVFGFLNTYKYSLTFILRRTVRLNDLDFTKELFELLSRNRFCNAAAKPWSDKWSLDFIVDETLAAPPDYLSLTPEHEALIRSYKTQ